MMHFSSHKDMSISFSFFSKHTTSFINAGVIFFDKFKLLYVLSLVLSNAFFLSQKYGFALEKPSVPLIRDRSGPVLQLIALSSTYSEILFPSYYLSCILPRALETVFKNLFKPQDTLESSQHCDLHFTTEIQTWMG